MPTGSDPSSLQDFSQRYRESIAPAVFNAVYPPASRAFETVTGVPLGTAIMVYPEYMTSGAVLGGIAGGLISRVLGGSFSTGFLLGTLIGVPLSVNIGAQGGKISVDSVVSSDGKVTVDTFANLLAVLSRRGDVIRTFLTGRRPGEGK